MSAPMTAVRRITRWPMSPFLAACLSYLQKDLPHLLTQNKKLKAVKENHRSFLRTKIVTETEKMQVVVGQTY